MTEYMVKICSVEGEGKGRGNRIYGENMRCGDHSVQFRHMVTLTLLSGTLNDCISPLFPMIVFLKLAGNRSNGMFTPSNSDILHSFGCYQGSVKVLVRFTFHP